MEPESAKPVAASPLELALLAAILDGPACRSGDSRDALLRAMALLEESAALCQEFGPLPLADRRRWLTERFLPGPAGEAPLRLFTALQRSASASVARDSVVTRDSAPPEEPSYYLSRLGKIGETGDSLRAYLAQHCNLEGRRGSKYARTETVLKNLKAWIAASLDGTGGAAVSAARAKFLADHANRDAAGRVVGYTFPKVTIDLFVAWRLQAGTSRFHTPGAPPQRKKFRKVEEKSA